VAAPCVPEDAVARQIIARCEACFDTHRGDCNQFLKAALADFLATDYFAGLDADAIVTKLRSPAAGWTATRKITDAIVAAKAGHLVVAGMTAAALRQHHGHVAVVVGCDGQISGTVMVPLGYAGALDNPPAQLRGGRLSGTFDADLVRSEGLDYYAKLPDRTPA